MALKSAFISTSFLFSCIVSFAQNGFLFQPQIGFGVSKISGFESPYVACDCGMGIGRQKPVLSIEAEAKIGFQYKFFRIYTGLQFIRTSSVTNAKYEYYPSGTQTIISAPDKYNQYNHLDIPISIGLNIPIKKKWSITPEIGTQILFVAQNDRSLSNAQGFIFMSKFNMEYELSGRISIVATPSFYNLVSPFYYTTPNGDQPFNVKAVNNVFMLQAGILWRFPHNTRIKNLKIPKSKIPNPN